MEVLKKSWNFLTADHESRTRSSDNSISTGLLQWFGYGRLSVYVLDSQFVMLGGRQTIFLTPYFQFEKRFDFLFVYVMNTCDYCLCLPSWHHGKRRKLSWKVMEKSWNFIIRFLWEPWHGVRYERRQAAVTTSPAHILTRAVLRLVWPFDGIVQN